MQQVTTKIRLDRRFVCQTRAGDPAPGMWPPASRHDGAIGAGQDRLPFHAAVDIQPQPPVCPCGTLSRIKRGGKCSIPDDDGLRPNRAREVPGPVSTVAAHHPRRRNALGAEKRDGRQAPEALHQYTPEKARHLHQQAGSGVTVHCAPAYRALLGTRHGGNNLGRVQVPPTERWQACTRRGRTWPLWHGTMFLGPSICRRWPKV
jgi:hypothetical protein